MLVVAKAQLDALDSAGAHRFAARLLAYLCQRQPAVLPRFPPPVRLRADALAGDLRPMRGEMDRKTELVIEICKQIPSSRRLADVDWESASLVIEVADGRRSNRGFAYLAGAAVKPIAVMGIGDLADELRTVMQVPGEEPWREMLVQIRRADGRIKADFHYGDQPRWPIGPATLDRMKEELRPVFD